ncbi:hypothetical protein [Amycolatopsis pittospori]|uniref:hypothetical protein n=1 Tax=Amycolatopsis pittospori TaxID=2749434 RepID=UPI0015F107C1|nr:hypothetical protein [Amycolatopsis pittospori]
MDLQLAGPWLIVAGYAAGFGLLFLGNRFDGRRPTAAAVCYALSGVAFSETSLYWLSAVTEVAQWLWFAVPPAIVALVVWRGYRQRTWIRRLGGSGTQSFGVLPRDGIALAYEDADPVATLVEFDRNGHRLLGAEYTLGRPEGLGEPIRTADLIDGTYTLIQLRTPVVPSLVVTPNVGAFEPERFTPFEDARITRNTIGSPKPDALLQRFETGSDFDRRFTITTSDPEFARAFLTPEVRDLLTRDPWFRVREVALHGGSLWATEAGTLTEQRMFIGVRRLALLASAADWSDEAFGAVAKAADTADGAGPGGSLNRRREAADRQPLSALSLVTRSVIALALVLPGLALAVNSLTALTGLAPEVRLTVTATLRAEASTANCTSCGNGNLVDGTYELSGETVRVTDMRWMSFGDFPERGDVVDVSVGPLWWHPLIESTDTGVFLLLIGLAPVVAGAALAKATYLPRPRRSDLRLAG